MFSIVTVPDEAANQTEPLGTKQKFWFRDEDSRRCLFKEGRPNSGDDWSEKVASELCELIGLPHVHYELALWRGRRGVVSWTFVPTEGRLVHGNELLAKVVRGYPETKFFRVSQHTVRRVLAILKNPRIQPPIGWTGFTGIETAIDIFVGYLMFDAWIANQDRHHENWGYITTPMATYLAPSYDHASSLGSNEMDTNREERLTTRDRRRSIEWYVERATSAFYASPSSKKPLSTLEAFREAGKRRPKAAAAWLERLQQVSSQNVLFIFEQIPSDRITPIAHRFAQKMLELNRQRLLTLQGV